MLIAVGLCFFYCCDPMQQSVLPPCVFHEMTGWNCIGCGGTRAFHLILHGRILESLRYNLLCIPFLGVFSYIVISLVLRKTRFAIPEIHPGVPGMSVFLVLLFVFMLLRNIPVYPLILLSP